MGVYITNATVKQVMKVLMNSTEWLPDKAEIIEISTPHGRLIDVDKIGVWWTNDARIAIEHAPTVIKAEVE